MNRCGFEVVLTGSLPKSKVAGVRDAKGACPVPDRFTTGAGDVKFPCSVVVPVLNPRAVGVKLTLTEQLALTARDVPQLLVWAKSPLITTPVIASAESPELVNVMVWVELVVLSGAGAKVSDVGDAVARIACPVPLRETTGAVPGELLVKESTPVRAPRTVGVKVTLTVQFAPAAIDVPQLFV